MRADAVTEVVFVGLPGPTHHYSGLSPDNVASSHNRGSESNPRQAALQALDLVRLLKSLGIEAGILPPPLRPHLPTLRLHFNGSDEEVIAQAGKSARGLLEKAASASSMWTANAATIAPSVDCADGKLHLTVANLFTNLHRRIEAEDTLRLLEAIFAGVPDCDIHRPLSAAGGQRDEGAANHMRLSPTHGARGLHVFVYGTDDGRNDPESARQTLSASRAVAQLHQLPASQVHFTKQSPHVITEGVFHNDVIAVSNGPVLLAHEDAYAMGLSDIDAIAAKYRALHPREELVPIIITEDDLTVSEAVDTYFFNSQIVTRPDGGMSVIAPGEAQTQHEGKAAALFERIRADSSNPIDDIRYIDLRQSMRNGGGPACLRLRVPVNTAQLTALHAGPRVLVDDLMLESIARLIEKHYPEQVGPVDLAEPALYHASKSVQSGLQDIMRLPLAAPRLD